MNHNPNREYSYKLSYLLRFRGVLMRLLVQQVFNLVQFCVLRLRLFECEMQMISRHGLRWRECVFDDQVVQILKMFDDFNFTWWWRPWPKNKPK